MSKGTHDYAADPRNGDIKIGLNGGLVPRSEAKVSVFDSGFVLGDGVWEGLRLHSGGLPFLSMHLDRLYEGAKVLDLDIGLTREELTRRILDVLRANGMRDHVHIRLMVTRGIKATPHQDPRFVIGPPTIAIVPEYKEPLPETVKRGIRLFTVHVRRGAPDVQDPKLNSHSKLNCILACIQAAKA
ncbi:MAG: aminotransferase class IV, partial [Gammaproteobacteria bacterium]